MVGLLTEGPWDYCLTLKAHLVSGGKVSARVLLGIESVKIGLKIKLPSTGVISFPLTGVIIMPSSPLMIVTLPSGTTFR